jgi:parallel beta-helix repeat protein
MEIGKHILQVKAEDESGNIDETPVEFLWTVEKRPYLVISEIQIAGIRSADDEFIELYNASDSDIQLDGFKIVKKIDSKVNEVVLVTSDVLAQKTIKALSYLLVARTDYYSGIAVPDIWWPKSEIYGLANDNTIILYGSDDEVVDKVGWGSAVDFEGSAFAVNPSGGQSLERKANADSTDISLDSGADAYQGNGWDTNKNNADFVLQAIPYPQNSSSISEPVLTPVRNITKGSSYPTIQLAIDRATEGDEIHVQSGTYHEQVVVNKKLILKGLDAGEGNPIVASKGGVAAIIIGGTGGIVFDGFKVINSDEKKSGSVGINIKSSDNIIKNNYVSSNYRGILLEDAGNNILSDNIADLNTYEGIALERSSQNTIENNIVSNSPYGIQIGERSQDNTFSNNTVNSNGNAGVFISNGYNNIIKNNNIASSTSYGVFIYSGVGNKIYHNNFIDNGESVQDKTGSYNIWDDGYPSGGNFWSDHIAKAKTEDVKSGENQDEEGSDGIADRAYRIYCYNFSGCGTGSYDRYPLMNSFGD